MSWARLVCISWFESDFLLKDEVMDPLPPYELECRYVRVCESVNVAESQTYIYIYRHIYICVLKSKVYVYI